MLDRGFPSEACCRITPKLSCERSDREALGMLAFICLMPSAHKSDPTGARLLQRTLARLEWEPEVLEVIVALLGSQGPWGESKGSETAGEVKSVRDRILWHH